MGGHTHRIFHAVEKARREINQCTLKTRHIASNFNREYKRLFSEPPMFIVERMHELLTISDGVK
jgi:hypothetical protein